MKKILSILLISSVVIAEDYAISSDSLLDSVSTISNYSNEDITLSGNDIETIVGGDTIIDDDINSDTILDDSVDVISNDNLNDIDIGDTIISDGVIAGEIINEEVIGSEVIGEEPLIESSIEEIIDGDVVGEAEIVESDLAINDDSIDVYSLDSYKNCADGNCLDRAVESIIETEPTVEVEPIIEPQPITTNSKQSKPCKVAETTGNSEREPNNNIKESINNQHIYTQFPIHIEGYIMDSNCFKDRDVFTIDTDHNMVINLLWNDKNLLPLIHIYDNHNNLVETFSYKDSLSDNLSYANNIYGRSLKKVFYINRPGSYYIVLSNTSNIFTKKYKYILSMSKHSPYKSRIINKTQKVLSNTFDFSMLHDYKRAYDSHSISDIYNRSLLNNQNCKGCGNQPIRNRSSLSHIFN
jgi:hypothetical protein